METIETLISCLKKFQKKIINIEIKATDKAGRTNWSTKKYVIKPKTEGIMKRIE